jgi:hypothetical protein
MSNARLLMLLFPEWGKQVAKVFVANSELTEILWQKLRTYREYPHGFPVAIVPDSRSGWKAVTAPYVIRRYPKCVKRVEEAQNELRKIYGLKAS